MLLAEPAIDAVIVDVRLRAGRLLPRLAPRDLPGDPRALREERGGRPAHRLRRARGARRARDGRRQALRLPARRRGADRRQRPPLRAARQGAGPRCAACSSVSQKIQVERRRPPRRAARSSSRTPSACCSRSPTPRRAGDFRSIEEILHEEIDKLEQLSRDGQSVTGTPSGFKDLDDITGGFQHSNLIVLAARPSMGKSALVTNIAENVAVKHSRPVALFSLEMSETELAQRFVASQARMSGRQAAQGPGRAQRLAEGREGLRGARARRRSGSTTPPTSTSSSCARRRAACTRSEHEQRRPRPDHRRLPAADAGRPSADSRVEQVGQISRGLKILARELSVPVIAVSQLNRAPEQRPGQAAAALGPARERPDRAGRRPRDVHLPRRVLQPGDRGRQGIAEIIVAKHRNGPTGTTSS